MSDSICGHPYCGSRCGYMPGPKLPHVHGKGLGTGLPNDGDYADIELRMLEFLHQDETETENGA